MDAFSIVLSFIFGAIIGSFLNVVSLRFNTGVTLGGRSKCMSCGEGLTWKELIPLFSFMVQKGACRKCKSKISWQYPLVEFVAGVFFVLIIIVYPPTSLETTITTVLTIINLCLLLVICAYDVKHKIIPDRFVYAFAAVALAGLFIGGPSLWHIPTYWQLIAGPLLALPFALLWLVSGGTWMGLGDVKLMLGIGWVLGISQGLNAVILSFWIAAGVSVLWILLTKKRYKPRMEIPFGPYLILGMYLVLLFGIEVLDVRMLKEIIWSYLL